MSDRVVLGFMSDSCVNHQQDEEELMNDEEEEDFELMECIKCFNKNDSRKLNGNNNRNSIIENNLTSGESFNGFNNVNRPSTRPFEDFFNIFFNYGAKDTFDNIQTNTEQEKVHRSSISNKEYRRIRKKVLERVLKQLKTNGETSMVIPKRREIKDIMDTMFARSNGYSLKVVAYSFRKVWTKIFRDIVESGMDSKLKTIKKLYPNDTVVYVPNHRSYMDFLLLSYVCFLCKVYPIPNIIAGEDFLQMMLVSDVMKHCGALFMKRQFNDQPVYKTVFKEYICTLLEEGSFLEFFVEGTRSRNGKTYHPKFGILNLVIDAYMQKRVSNIVFVPVYVSYESMMESQSHVREMLGESKKKETTANMITGLLDSITTNFGDIALKIGDPISLSSFLADPNNEGLRKNRRELSSQLGFSITKSLNDNYTCLSSHIISSLLLQYLGDVRLADKRCTIPFSTLIEKVSWLKDEIQRRNVPLYLNEAERMPNQMIERTLQVFKGHVEMKGLSIRVKSPRDFLLLSIYKNSLAPVFTKESLLLCALHSLRLKDVNFEEIVELETQPFDIEEWKERCSVLGELLSLEIHPQDMLDSSERFNSTLSDMEERGILTCQKVEGGKISVKINNLGYFEFVCSLLWPSIDTYSIIIGYCCLIANRGTIHSFALDKFVKSCHEFLEKLYHETSVPFYESVSVLTIRNVISRYSTWNILHRVSVNNVNTIQISEYYANQPSEIREWWDIISLYAKYKQKENFFDLYIDFVPVNRISKL
ncbi:glyceronephosphate O-acyltransferase [Naegleria gruberi]|uniref:Glyceronephosphate O-acyltransferase n=1 Tax=Naegleria gruberi TaxID=5762 RepID=D2UZ07_NAEGR|nr:glyceronephosphate O-acyltransferase [Naegleria gruberi]EFC49864.1 glyceronephosphate O-acyltransferase [Naegleria gruberi]|eukprot:XP_002682608.1 glyceronephosphate O-acyltransferase [Naegleria gruberi strain NEG-M]